jgi:hypothetical protein
LGFAKNRDVNGGYDWITNIVCVFLSILFVIVIFLTRNVNEYYGGGQSPVGRFIHLGFLWMLVFSVAIVVHAGNYIAKNGFNKIYAALFILGYAGMICYSATYSNIYSYNVGRMKLAEKTKTFIEKYRKLSQKNNVIPFDCNVSRSFEIRTTLLLSKLEDELGLDYFFAKEGIKKIIDNTKTPFYLFTRLNPEILNQNLEPTGLHPIPDTAYDFFGCKFYLIDRIKQE